MTEAPQQLAVAQAERLAADVLRHKRLAAHHRRQARARAQQLAVLRARLAGMGIRLVTPGEAPEEERHGRQQHPRTARA